MFAWLGANLINLVLIALIVLTVVLIVRRMILDKRAGKSSCGCDCSSCAACPHCAACRRAER